MYGTQRKLHNEIQRFFVKNLKKSWRFNTVRLNNIQRQQISSTYGLVQNIVEFLFSVQDN